MENLLRQSCKDTENLNNKTFGNQFWHLSRNGHFLQYNFKSFFFPSCITSVLVSQFCSWPETIENVKLIAVSQHFSAQNHIIYLNVHEQYVRRNTKRKWLNQIVANSVVLDQLLPCWISLHEFHTRRKLFKVNLLHEAEIYYFSNQWLAMYFLLHSGVEIGSLLNTFSGNEFKTSAWFHYS